MSVPSWTSNGEATQCSLHRPHDARGSIHVMLRVSLLGNLMGGAALLHPGVSESVVAAEAPLAALVKRFGEEVPGLLRELLDDGRLPQSFGHAAHQHMQDQRGHGEVIARWGCVFGAEAGPLAHVANFRRDRKAEYHLVYERANAERGEETAEGQDRSESAIRQNKNHARQ
eukprot:NODE_11710_length_1269_cov_4.583187.p2 GENE.NODE_11710_length_1269_cov_4.583187~~NODE_11710_length_1269_cov_4.583187.p2  ORF type:complete len:171 (-),score=14.50 NODE_11710_length_1269_cov_4.583187:135-647(-)